MPESGNGDTLCPLPRTLRGYEVAQCQYRPKPGLLQAQSSPPQAFAAAAWGHFLGLYHPPQTSQPHSLGIKQRPWWGLGRALWSSSATYSQAWK